jgi:hypothetical protein
MPVYFVTDESQCRRKGIYAMNPPDDILELLDDLLHDLGKYIALPITMLPEKASQTDLRNAIFFAVRETRTSPLGTQTAQEIWQTFCDDSGNQLVNLPGWHTLTRAVEVACAWADRVGQEAYEINRINLTNDMRAVSAAIRALQDEMDE